MSVPLAAFAIPFSQNERYVAEHFHFFPSAPFLLCFVNKQQVKGGGAWKGGEQPPWPARKYRWMWEAL